MTSSPNYEAQFAHRFTELDEEFQRYLQQAPSEPPVVEAWRAQGGFHRGRDYRFGGGRQHGSQEWNRGQDYGGGRGWANNSKSSHSRQERHWGPDGGEKNTYNRRPHY